MSQLPVAALYKFVDFPDFAEWKVPLENFCVEHGILGTILLAPEGINGTLCAPRMQLDLLLARLAEDERFAELEVKFSAAQEPPFRRMKVRLKREIVSMGRPDVDPSRLVGTYVEPEEWNRLIEDPDVIVVDTRNDYEVAIGSFDGARDPGLGSFREFPQWLQQEFDGSSQPKVAMFCTGGIRCEKATSFLKARGIEEVYHLKGGILRYLERVPEAESHWQGECFVFDERVAVGHGLSAGSYELCRACRKPIDEADKTSNLYEEGVSCPRCHGDLTPEQRASFAERARQVRMARERGAEHLKDPREARRSSKR